MKQKEDCAILNMEKCTMSLYVEQELLHVTLLVLREKDVWYSAISHASLSAVAKTSFQNVKQLFCYIRDTTKLLAFNKAGRLQIGFIEMPKLRNFDLYLTKVSLAAEARNIEPRQVQSQIAPIRLPQNQNDCICQKQCPIHKKCPQTWKIRAQLARDDHEVKLDNQGISVEGIIEIVSLKWDGLKEISLFGNKINTEAFSFFTSIAWPELISINLGSNIIREILWWPENVPKLQTFHINHNRIKQLPENMALLKSLEMLGINNNEITVVPPVLSKLTKLQKLQIQGNPIPKIDQNSIIIELKDRGVQFINRNCQHT